MSSNGSSSSVLLSSIDFTVTDRMTNYSSSQQGKSLIKLTDTEDILCNGQNKIKNYDQNKNKIGKFDYCLKLFKILSLINCYVFLKLENERWHW